jgi:SAM-dependent methyltransferase
MPNSDAKTPVQCFLCGDGASFYCELDGGTYFRCSQCGSMFLHPTPTLEEMRTYAESHYKAGVYTEYTKARPLKLATFRGRIELIKKHKPSGKLLDLGCACGFMIEAALEAGYDAYGVEFSEEAINAAAPAIRERIRQGDINQVPAGEFDVITAFDILEHTQDPLVSLRQWATLLKPGGLLVVTSPDTDSMFRKVMRSRWPMLQPLQHTFMFSGSGMNDVLSRAGLRPLEVRSANKVMTVDYLVGQLQIYFPTPVKIFQSASKALLGATGLPIPFRIGEFIAVAQK